MVPFLTLDSWKDKVAPAELGHEADHVSGRHRRPVPAGALAEGAGGSKRSAVPRGQIHSGQEFIVVFKS